MISRRSLFLGSAALLAAPSIVRVASLMPVSLLATKPRYIIYENTGRVVMTPGIVTPYTARDVVSYSGLTFNGTTDVLVTTSYGFPPDAKGYLDHLEGGGPA